MQNLIIIEMGDTLPNKNNANTDLHDKDLSGQDLSAYIFTNCNLTGVNFSGCKFNSQTDFTGASFGKSVTGKVTSFANCTLTEAKFTKPVPFGKNTDEKARVNFTKATIPWDLLGRKIENVDLTGAVFVNMPSKLNAYVFYGVKWNNFDFAGRSLYNSSFSLCDLTGCKMTGSTLDYVSFLMASNLTNVKMNKCSLIKTIFKGSTMTDTDLSYATNLQQCSFANTYLNGTIFDGNDLRDSTFGIPNRMSKSRDHITSFQFAKIATKFLTENIQYNWQCIDFRNVIIEDFATIKGNLSNLLAMNSMFNSSLNFEGAKLNGANFSGATFSSVNFNNASLNNANFTAAKTLEGKQASRRAARFILPETDSEYAEFLLALTNNVTPKIAKMFARFNIKLGNIQCRPKGTTASSFSIIETVSPQKNRDVYSILKVPMAVDQTKFELVAFEELPSTFINAHLIGCAMQECDFSNADLSNVQLYGSQLIAATLSNTILKAAQLGNNADIFSVSKNDPTLSPSYNYDTFLNALTNSSIYTLIDVFQHNGFALGNAKCIPDGTTGNAWKITDSNGVEPVIFSVKNIIRDPASGSNELKVCCSSYTSATLDDAYMPGVVLTGANLTGCSAQGCHLYNNDATSSDSTLEKATLIDTNFMGANLYKASFKDANLSGAIFTGANLMYASFNNATLDQSTANLSFREANLQGADFSTAKNINSANFLNAAVCTPIGSATYGVFIGRIAKTDTKFEDVLADLRRPTVVSIVSNIYNLAGLLVDGKKINIELKAALSKNITISGNAMVKKLETEWTFKIKDGEKEYYFIKGYDERTNVVFNVYKKDLDSLYCNIPIVTFTVGVVSPAMIASLATSSDNKLKISDTAKIESYDRPILWSIKDDENKKEYTMWWGVTSVNDDATSALMIRETFSALPSVCKKLNAPFRDQSTVTKPNNRLIDNEDFWELDNGRMDSFLMMPGYITLRIVHKKTDTAETLNFYGYGIRMIGLGTNQREVVQDFMCSPTKLPIELLNDQTIFPNKFTKTQNKTKLTPLDQWMWVEKKLPTPPICVPTATSFCPMPKQTKHKKYKKHGIITRTKR
ncbi:MAG: hypothetical protein EOO91_01780 [Pedobacter sp.]|nr:MAG: hypothetical protein EOO91_01780 [Pedobacter sp.]